MKTTLIITTYNWKEALKVVLESVKHQTILPNEVIVADDGSREDTKLLIEEMAQNFPVALIHSWQIDDGFRAAQSRNRAIAKSSGDYIIIIDGDIVLPQNFIADHLKNAKKEQFIQGGRVLLNQKLTHNLILEGKLPSIFSKGIKNRKNMISSEIFSAVFSKISNTDKSTRSCNMSFWREDILEINGFNNDFVGWGREDSEFVHRMLNAGKTRLYLKFAGVGYHLYHNENSRASLAQNDEILEKTIQQHLKRCENGVDQFISGTGDE
ncbi:glycosyltransferase family 2 protein [Vibrio fluminensis]|uniref:glycosyltransferase family 2 protein n=1 Tax=Vibrio fluminensis TaxID=2783614 RepID=UPI001888A1D0|nr:glycosyltransferase family 2 protein [Vibrio fluminensis]